VAEAIGALLCAQVDGLIISLDLATGARLDETFFHQHGPATPLGVAADGSAIIAAGGSAIARWRLDGGGAASHLLRAGPAQEPLDYLRSGSLLVRRFDWTNGATVDLDLIDPETGAVIDPLDGVAVATRGQVPGRLAVMLDDGRTGGYDPARRELVFVPEDPPPFAPSGATVAGDVLILWDDDAMVGIDQNGRRTSPVGRAVERILRVVVSADGSRLFTLEPAGLVPRRATGEPTGQPTLPGIIQAAATSDLVVVTRVDGRLQVLDADTLEPSGAEIPAIAGVVELLRLSRDERRLLAVGLAGEIRIVDMATRSFLGGEIDLRLGRERLSVGTVISDDGEQIATSTPLGIVVWDLAPDALLASACTVAGRDLTEQEWQDHIGDLAPYRPVCPGDADSS
jgi:hypothetical protein